MRSRVPAPWAGAIWWVRYRRRAGSRAVARSIRTRAWCFALIDKLTSRLEMPRRLRAFVRARESSLIALAAIVGAIAGVVVALMSTGVDVLHRLFFHLEPGVRLSGLLRLDPVVAISVPLAGEIGRAHV